MPICKNCNKEFPNKIKVEEEIINLTSRKFCLFCSPLKQNNTRSYIINLNKNEGFCVRCNKVKSLNEFYKRKSGKPYSYCMNCQGEVKELKFGENLEIMVAEKKGCCEDCKIVYPSVIYEFYQKGKRYNASKLKNMSIEKIREELKDFDMLCKNCSALRDWLVEGKDI